ncbi:MAG: hypothetical protein OHK0045_10820 [Raineya sp.]
MASKKELLEQTKMVEEAIAEELTHLQENIWQKIKIGFTIAFVGVGTYWLLKKYFDYTPQYQDLQENKIKQEENNNIPSSTQELDIVQMIKKEIAMFLLAIAKQKIQELLQRFYYMKNFEEDEQNDQNQS